MYNDVGFLITAFEQEKLCEIGIQRIRNYKKLGNCPIHIVTTSENPKLFKYLEKDYPRVWVHNYIEAPGNKGSEWTTKRQVGDYVLPARIFNSMEIGCNALADLGYKRCVHIHTDSWFELESELLLRLDIIKEKYVVADLSLEDEVSAAFNKVAPAGLCLHVEGLILNLDRLATTGYLDFSHIFHNPQFDAHDWKSIESLLGQWLIFCMTGKNITKYADQIPREYFDWVFFGLNRNYHAMFSNGFCNLPGKQ
jgi:hypothetical protein